MKIRFKVIGARLALVGLALIAPARARQLVPDGLSLVSGMASSNGTASINGSSTLDGMCPSSIPCSSS